MENVKAANTGKACLANSTFSDCREGKGPGVGTVSSAWVAESASKLPSQNSLVRKEIILFAFLKPGDAHPSVNSQFSARSLHRLFLLSFFLKCCSSKQTTNEMADEYWQSWNNMLYGGKKACSNKGRKIHNNKKPVKERENEGTSLDTVTEAFKVFFFQNKGCCVQPPLPLLIPAAPSVVPAQVLCDCELNQIKALIQGKKNKNNSTTKNKQEKKDRTKENCKAAATAVKRDVRQVTASPGLSKPGVAEQTGGPRCLGTCSQDRQWRHTGLSYHRLQQNLISKSKIQVVRLTTMKHEHKVLYHKLRWIEHGWNLSHCCNT